MTARALRVGLVMFVVGGLAASLLLILSPALYLTLTDGLAWRIGLKSVAQHRLEKTLTGVQLHIDRMQSAPGAVWFGDSHLQHFPPALQDGIVTNFAIGGETAIDLAARMPRYTSIRNARAVVLLSGRNDLQQGLPVTAITQAFTRMLGELPANLPVTLVDVPPAREAADKVAQRRAINAHLQQLCAARAACRHVPLDLLADAEGQLQAQYDAGDGIHLNAEGYRVLSGLIHAR
ncbi:SGNH/GDSL hydrolase family protein [Viridibacterium curvum]|uniref:SGNH hydrolase-type esterase domain-containing protein n=1 Tax=Viridibacterium curvum TaxID=1101404 RepID=A0ABP9QPA2_9RHOO